jgi:thioredoxin reductase (NADPH)
MSTFPIVIIGAGPAGISTAIEAINRGYKPEEIIILEKFGQIAHMINTKYPDEKPILSNYKGRLAACLGDMCITNMTKKEFFDYLHDVVAKYKLHINYNQQVSRITKLKTGQFNVETNNDTYTCTAVFVAIGNMAAPRTLGVNVGPDSSMRLHFDIQNLADDAKKVLVVGGGDSAAEYSKILSDRGYEVTLSYRGADFTRMIEQNALNTKALIESKTISHLSESEIEKIDDEKPGISLIHFKGGKFPPTQFSAVVVALGAERPSNYLQAIGIDTVMESGEFFSESKMSGLFCVGDLAAGKGGGSINFAFNSGVKAVSMACDMYLDCSLPAMKKAG